MTSDSEEEEFEEEASSASDGEPPAASDSEYDAAADGEEEASSSSGEEAGGGGGGGEASDATDGGEEEEAEEDPEDEDNPTQLQLEKRREQNIKALVSGTELAVSRAPLLPRLLTVQQAAVVLRRPFKSPHPNAPAVSERKLAARKTFVPWGGGKFVPLKLKVPPREPLLLEEPLPAGTAAAAAAEPAVVLPPGIEPLVLWEPPAGVEGSPVRVDDMLTQWLRPHQREGVQFMFECVCGLRSFQGQGCILADDMGLGKTLQGISLLWTLLSCKGHPLLGGEPIAKRIVICCPTSLVGNWDSECQKWLNGRVRTLPLCESSREEAVASISQFLSPRNPYQVMIVSYETFRIHAERFRAEGTCDLLICDEAHRLKNDATLTNRALDSLACRRRVLLSGTPLQNRLDEFYAMVSFCNPGVLGTPAQFRRHFEAPILAGREPDASEGEVALCQERTAELSTLVNEFILRRTNTLLSEHLPPKVVEIVCCRLTPLQLALYCHFLESKATRSLFATQKAARVLSAITSLRKLLNHPKLIYDALHSARGDGGGKEAEGFEGCADFFPPGLFGGGRTGRGGVPAGWELLSGKFAVLAGMLEILRTCTRDRIVIVSNYTQTLDLVAQLCRDRNYPFVRLDGTTTIKKRNKLVKDFNDPAQTQFAFLLSSKAGGCGLNLIGGNRLVLFDPSWNPADDKQAAARVWRDGQKKKVYVYRFIATGTIEEKVYQRQLSKEGLQQVVDSKAGGKSAGPNLMSVNELRDLFSYDPDTLSTTYDSMVVAREKGDRKQDPAAAAGKKGAKVAGGKQQGQRRGRPAGGARKNSKRRRRSAWSSSSSEEEEEEEEPEEESEEEGWSEGGGSEVVILDSDEEEVERQQQQQQQQPAAGNGDGMDASPAAGWSSDEEAGPAVAPAQQQQQGGVEQQQAEERGHQGPAQPLPSPVQQQQQGEGQPPAAGGVAGEGGGGSSTQQVVPTAVLKRTGAVLHKEQVGKPGEEQLRLWGHHSSTTSVPDPVLRQIGDEWVSFVFSLQVDGRAIDPEPPLVPLSQPGGQGPGRRRLGGGVAPRPAAAVVGGSRPAAAVGQQAAAGAAAAARPVAPTAAVVAARPTASAAASVPSDTVASTAGQQQQQPMIAKENAGSNAAPTRKLALPQRPKAPLPVAGGAAAAKPRHTLQRALVISDSDDDDFK